MKKKIWQVKLESKYFSFMEKNIHVIPLLYLPLSWPSVPEDTNKPLSNGCHWTTEVEALVVEVKFEVIPTTSAMDFGLSLLLTLAWFVSWIAINPSELPASTYLHSEK